MIRIGRFEILDQLWISKLTSYQISNKRRVTIQKFKGKTLVAIREYYEKDGKQMPGKSGISLTPEQFMSFLWAMDDIKKALKTDFNETLDEDDDEVSDDDEDKDEEDDIIDEEW